MKHKNTKQAKATSIKNYGGFCILTGGQNVVGCHLFSAGSNADLKCYDENIIPADPRRHTTGHDTLDWIVFGEKARTPIDKIYYLLDLEKGVRGEYMEQFIRQMNALAVIMESKPVHKMNAELLRSIVNERWPM